MTRICFCNPFGTDQFDDLVLETLTPYLREGTVVESVHIADCPRNIDYYLPKHLVETELFKLILAAEEDGFDAFVIGCCYDPGLTVAREITSMPVVGPLEACDRQRAAVRPALQRRHRPPQGRARARGPRPQVRDVAELPLGARDRLVRR